MGTQSVTTDQQKLKALESQIRPWQSQLSSGHRPVQENWCATIEQTRVVHAWEESIIDGMLQTADYARHIFIRYAEMRNSPRDTDEAVHARLKRQEMLYQPGRKFHILMWEAALHALICPPTVLAAQLDHLAGVMDVDSVELGVVPFHAPLKIPPANSFIILDDRVAVTEDWHAELWLEDADTIATYLKIWNTLRESAVYGAQAQNIINRARRSVSSA